jgi:hypothetical protein
MWPSPVAVSLSSQRVVTESARPDNGSRKKPLVSDRRWSMSESRRSSRVVIVQTSARYCAPM